MIRSIIIENELIAVKQLASLLHSNFPEVDVMATCESVNESIQVIKKLKPELVFMDVELNNETCFDLLKKLGRINFEIIFTTAFDKYAKQAFRVSAVDFLEKPIDKVELAEAIMKYKKRKTPAIDPRQIEILLSAYHSPTAPLKKFALPTMYGLEFVETDSIVCCEGSDNQTKIHFSDKPFKLISKSLKECEEQLTHSHFCRIHKSFLVNLNQVKEYKKGEDGELIMQNGKSFTVSRTYKNNFLDKFKNL